MIISDFTDPFLRKTKNKTAVIPVGSLEQHGPHLPISTDSEIVTYVARGLAKKCKLLVLPTITYGVSFEHAPFFNLSINDKILQNYLSEICVSLGQNKFNKIIILNGHHGNQKALKNIPNTVTKISRGRVRVFVFSYWHFMNQEFDHAGFAETSLMLVISNKVKMNLARKGLNTQNMTAQQKEKIAKIASTQFIKATKNGVWGDPTKATKKDGKALLVEIIQNLSREVSKLAH